MKSIVALILALAFAQRAFPGETTGTVTELLLLKDYPNLVFVRVSGANGNLPACSTANNRYVLDTSTNTGKQIYAALLAARHAGAAVTLVGLGTCDMVSNSEDLRGIAQN